MKNIILILFFVIGLAIVIFILEKPNLNWPIYPTITPTPPNGVFCTQDAKLCPDGSYVGRVPPSCEFATCPGNTNSGIQGIVLLGPICPVIKDPPDPECADKPYATRLAITTADQAIVIAEINSDENGRFTAALVPGEYAIRSAAAANILPYCSSNDTIKVNDGSYTETTVYCDTGIR